MQTKRAGNKIRGPDAVRISARTDRCFRSVRFPDNHYRRCKMGKPDKMPSPKVEEFADALQEWARQDEERETLAKWLLTRTVSHRFEGTGGKFVIERRDIDDFDIKKAVTHALAECKPNPGLYTSGWVRGGPNWPKAYGPDNWLKAYGC